MSNGPPRRSPLSDPLVKVLLGFFGTLFGILLLPRAIKLFFRKLVLGTLGEIVAIVVTGLLTEKAVDFFKKDDE